MLIVSLILAGVFWRIAPHPSNVTPVLAAALFTGVRISVTASVGTTLGTMLLSDLVLGFHPVMPWVYGSLFLVGLMGNRYRNGINVYNVWFPAFLGSVLFFLATNTGVWVTTALYPKTAGGLLECFIMALPFFRNSLFGDILFSTAIFSVYALSKKYGYLVLGRKKCTNCVHSLGEG